MTDHPNAAGRALLQLFDLVIVVNLPARSDRRKEMSDQLSRLGLSFDHPQVSLFEAIRPADKGDFGTLGTKGCFLSHVGALETAIASGAQSFLILEDDADLAPDFEARIARLADLSSKHAWGFWQGWNPDSRGAPAEGELMVLPSDISFPGAHFLGVSRDVATQVLPFLRGIASRPAGHKDGGAMHVDGAYGWFRKQHPDVVTIAPLQSVAFQRSSRTDIHDPKWYDRLTVLAPVVAIFRKLRRLRR